MSLLSSSRSFLLLSFLALLLNVDGSSGLSVLSGLEMALGSVHILRNHRRGGGGSANDYGYIFLDRKNSPF